MSLQWEVFTGGFCQTNGYLLSHEGRFAMVDAPDDSAEWLRGLGVKVEALLLTHQHFDHVMDAARIAADHACPILAFAQPSSELWLNRMFSQMTGWELEIPPYEVTTLVAEGTLVRVIGIDFTPLHVPGHSPDSVCFLHAAEGVCFSGDTLFEQGVGRTDFPGGSAEQLTAGIRGKLYTLPGATTILPGHGGATTVEAERAGNPWVRP